MKLRIALFLLALALFASAPHAARANHAHTFGEGNSGDGSDNAYTLQFTIVNTTTNYVVVSGNQVVDNSSYQPTTYVFPPGNTTISIPMLVYSWTTFGSYEQTDTILFSISPNADGSNATGFDQEDITFEPFDIFPGVSPIPNGPVDTLIVPPGIASFAPTTGKPGTQVTIDGAGFTGAFNVLFGGVAATVFTVYSDTQIIVTVPANAMDGPISVVTPAGTPSSAADFTVVFPPLIASFSPTSGGAGTVVTVTGLNFVPGSTQVTINGAAALIQSVTAMLITAQVLPGTITGGITVTTPQGSATSVIPFTAYPWHAMAIDPCADGTARLLIDRADGAAGVWVLDAADAQISAGPSYGPYYDSGGIWQAQAVRAAHDGTSRLLWTRSDGAAGLWSLDASGSETSVGPTYGPYVTPQGIWRAAGLGVSGDGTARMLWTRSDGAAIVWVMDAGGNQTGAGPVYGPYVETQGIWHAVGLATAADGTSRLLWERTDGAAGVWTLDAGGNETVIGAVYGPYHDPQGEWNATGVGATAGGASRILWTRTDGAAGLWSLDTNGTQTSIGPIYGPFYLTNSLWQAVGIGTDPSGQSRVLWSRSDLAYGAWTFSGDAATAMGPVFARQ